MPTIAQQCKDIINREGINLSSAIEYDINDKVHRMDY